MLVEFIKVNPREYISWVINLISCVSEPATRGTSTSGYNKYSHPQSHKLSLTRMTKEWKSPYNLVDYSQITPPSPLHVYVEDLGSRQDWELNEGKRRIWNMNSWTENHIKTGRERIGNFQTWFLHFLPICMYDHIQSWIHDFGVDSILWLENACIRKYF